MEVEKEMKDDIKDDINIVEQMVETAKNPQNAVRLEVTNKVSEKLRSDKEVETRVLNTADKVVDAGLTAVENEADKAVSDSESECLKAYFKTHEEELKTAGIEEYTYLEDMKRAVNWHRKCAKFHWIVCGWWMTLIRTFILKAKPFRILLNLVGILLNIGLICGVIYAITLLF